MSTYNKHLMFNTQESWQVFKLSLLNKNVPSVVTLMLHPDLKKLENGCVLHKIKSLFYMNSTNRLTKILDS